MEQQCLSSWSGGRAVGICVCGWGIKINCGSPCRGTAQRKRPGLLSPISVSGSSISLRRPHRLWRLSEFLNRQPWVSANGRRCEVQLSRPESSRNLSWQLVDGVGPLALVWPQAAREADLKRIFRAFARKALFIRLFDQVQRLGLELPQLTVRDQASRWGSCSSSGRISLNWRLVLLPPELQDYIILHELAHLAEMNHSGRFWASSRNTIRSAGHTRRRSTPAALPSCGSGADRHRAPFGEGQIRQLATTTEVYDSTELAEVRRWRSKIAKVREKIPMHLYFNIYLL